MTSLTALDGWKAAALGKGAVLKGFRALDDASRRFTNPSASMSLPAVTPGVAGANCPEDRSKRPRGFSLRCGSGSLHGSNPNTEPVR